MTKPIATKALASALVPTVVEGVSAHMTPAPLCGAIIDVHMIPGSQKKFVRADGTGSSGVYVAAEVAIEAQHWSAEPAAAVYVGICIVRQALTASVATLRLSCRVGREPAHDCQLRMQTLAQ